MDAPKPKKAKRTEGSESSSRNPDPVRPQGETATGPVGQALPKDGAGHDEDKEDEQVFE